MPRAWADYSIADRTAQRDNGPVRGAYDTARRVRRHAGEVDLWVVLSDLAGSVGDWFRRCVTGDLVASGVHGLPTMDQKEQQ